MSVWTSAVGPAVEAVVVEAVLGWTVAASLSFGIVVVAAAAVVVRVVDVAADGGLELA